MNSVHVHASSSIGSANAVERFHALDATRASALMLGVFFHAAWSFLPPVGNAFGAPVVDVKTSAVFGWLHFTSHSFRMQLFFLIAGFFARLLYQKRGAAGFVRNRITRIAVPFVVGWLILFPLIMSAWIHGANVSGRNLVQLPLPFLFQLLFEQRLMFVLPVQGGFFNLTHLWFLYYLLCVYGVTLLARGVLVRIPASAALRRGADMAVGRVASSTWPVLALTLLTGIFLWRMESWLGVDTPNNSPMPSAPVLLLYGGFFTLGWLFHRQTHLLQEFARRWKPLFLGGLILSVILYGIGTALSARGYVTGTWRAKYPNLSSDQITDWPGFVARLRSPAGTPNPNAELAYLWQRMPAPLRQRILQLSPDANPNVRAGVCDALNKLLVQEGLLSGNVAADAIPGPAKAARVRLENRATLNRVLEDAIIGDPLTLPSYRLYKFAFALGYALMTWLLVFGALGFFQATCSARSAAWRYAADSAYWIYLVHLPLVAALQVWMWDWNLPAAFKFTLLLAIAFTILFASYHYLVRSTFIGRVLNGQKYAFTPWPFQPVAGAPRPETPTFVAISK